MSFIPPSYSDILKASNDLFSKDYPVGSAKLEVNTSAANGVKFTATGTKDNKSGSITSELKTKYTDKPNGFTLTETWNTSNVLGAQIELADTISKGLKFDLNFNLHPSNGKKNAKAGFDYKLPNIFTRANVDLFKGPSLTADAVVGNESILFGADVSYDVQDAKVSKFNATVAHSTNEYTIAANASNLFGLFSFSYFHRVRPGLEAGARANWNRSIDSAVTVDVGAKYTLDKDAFLKAKVNNSGIVGLGYTQNIRQGVKLAFGGQFDSNRLGENAHKVGMSFSFEG